MSPKKNNDDKSENKSRSLSQSAKGRKQDGGNGGSVNKDTGTRRNKSQSSADAASAIDIEQNDSTLICKICDQSFTSYDDKLIECERCEMWVCKECAKLSETEYQILAKTNSKMHWYCEDCTASAMAAVKSDNLIEEKCKQYFDSLRAEYDKKKNLMSVKI